MMELGKFEKRVRIGSLLLMVLIGAELIRYTYRSFYRAYRFSFGEPERWNTHWAVDDGTLIEPFIRTQYFAVWGAVILASIACYVAALFMLNRIRRGQLFQVPVARNVQWVGGLIVFALVLDTIYMSADLWLLTQQNADGPMPISFYYDPSDLKTIILGGVLFLFGWVMKDAIAIDQENRGFV